MSDDYFKWLSSIEEESDLDGGGKI